MLPSRAASKSRRSSSANAASKLRSCAADVRWLSSSLDSERAHRPALRGARARRAPHCERVAHPGLGDAHAEAIRATRRRRNGRALDDRRPTQAEGVAGAAAEAAAKHAAEALFVGVGGRALGVSLGAIGREAERVATASGPPSCCAARSTAMQVSRPTDASCAASSADTPKRLRRHGSAPYANNIRMASTWPPRAASISGVVPDVAGSSTLARDSSSSTRGVDEAVERRGPQRRVRGERRVVVQDGESAQVGDHVRSGHVDVASSNPPRTARRLLPERRSCRASARTTSRRRAPRPASSERLGRRGENGGSRYPRRRAPGSPRPRGIAFVRGTP